MKIDRIKISDLSLDPANVRKHDRKNLDAIKASLRKFGQQKPIIVDAKGIVIAGNGTLTAAQELGWTEIDIVRTQLEGVEATMFAIADNRTAELAEWEDSLHDKLAEFISQGVDVETLGFDRDYINSLESNPVKIENLDVRKPPKQAWFLVQVPFEDLGPVQSALDNLPTSTKTFSTFTD